MATLRAREAHWELLAEEVLTSERGAVPVPGPPGLLLVLQALFLVARDSRHMSQGGPKIALRGGGGGWHGHPAKEGGGVPEMGFRAGPFVLCKDGCCHQRRRNTNHLEERLLDQARAWASYTPLFWGHSRSIPQGMILDVQPLVKSLFCPVRPSPNGFFDFEASTP